MYSATEYEYSGNVETPAVIVKDSEGTTLEENTDYTVTYALGRKEIGTYPVYVTFRGRYKGKNPRTLYFKIVPKTASIQSLTAGKRSLKVKAATKVSSLGGKYYQIGYKKQGTKTWKYITTAKDKKTIPSLKKGKRYYVKVHAYKKIVKKKYYGKWSAILVSNKIK